MAGFTNPFPTWKRSFDQRQDDYHKELRKLEQDHPFLYNAADAAGTIALGGLTAGAGVVARLGSSVVGRIALLAGEGAVHGTLRSNADTIGGRLEGGAVGAVAAPVASGVMKGGAKAVGTAVDTVAPARLINWISSGFKDFSKKVSGDASEFASRIVGYKNRAGEPVLRMRHNAEEALGSVRKAMKETNEDLGNIYLK